MPLKSSALASASDADLITALREGQNAAYAVLWDRHHKSGLTAARAITSSHDPEDLVQESFTRILTTISNGNGPTENFRAYLYSTIRSVSIAWSAKTAPTVDIESQSANLISDFDVASLTEDRQITARAFKNLPQDWQTVLWYSEIEGMSAAEIAPLMGINARAVSALAFRAREGLRESWLSAHLPVNRIAETEECRWMEENLSAYSRGNLTTKRTDRANNHLAECNDCSLLLAELNAVSVSLRAAILPLILGITPLAATTLFPAPAAAATAGTASGVIGTIGAFKEWATKSPLSAGAAATGAIVATAAAGVLTFQFLTEPVAVSNAQEMPAPSAVKLQDPAPARTAEPTSEPLTDPSPQTSTEAVTKPSAAAQTPPALPAPIAPSSSAAPAPVTPPQPSPESTSAPEVTPTPTPTPEPTPEPTQTPEPTPEPTPTTEDLLEVETVSEQSSILMPQFGGTAPVGSVIQIFSASNPAQAVSAPITVGATDPATFSAQDPTVELGRWVADVSSTSPTGTNLSYIAKRFADGKLVEEEAIAQTYSVEPLTERNFRLVSLIDEETGLTVGPTLETAQELDQINFELNVEGVDRDRYSLVINDLVRAPYTYSTPAREYTWHQTNTSALIPLRMQGNFIAVRRVDDSVTPIRYGPELLLHSFDIVQIAP